MNNHIIQQWNSIIKEDDLVFHLGDFALYANKEMVKESISKLNGNIILIEGNHDKRSKGWWRDTGIIETYKQYKIGDYILSHKPIEDLGYGLINIHGHLHGKDIGLNKERYIDVSCEKLNYTPIWVDWEDGY